MPRPAKPKRKPPHAFVIEALAPLDPEVRPMFSGFNVYIGDRLVCMLRDHPQSPRDNGPLAGAVRQSRIPPIASSAASIPSLRRIELLGGMIGHWLLVPSDGPDFEKEALHACDLLLRHDPRLGRVPKSRR